MPRLPQGVSKRKDGLYQKRFTVEGKRYSVYGRSTKELIDKELEKRKEIESGLNQSKTNVTLNKYFQEFINQKQGYVKPTTIYKYQSVYNARIKQALGNKHLKAIDKAFLLSFRDGMIKNEVSYEYINYVFVVLKSVFTNAVADEIILKNPLQGIKPLKSEKKEASETIHRALTEEEQKEFMEYLRNEKEWLYELFALMLNTGMRCSEALALTWSDIDYINNVIHVDKTLTVNASGQVVVGTPKTAKSKRDIPMNDNIRQILKSQRKKYNLLAEIEEVSINHVFISTRGNIVDKRTVGKHLERCIKKMNEQGFTIEKFTSHALRDTFATRFIEQGGTPQTLKAILGHSSLSMTMDLYAHVLPNTKAEEMNKIIIAI